MSLMSFNRISIMAVIFLFLAASSSRAELPPEAQNAVRKGIAAAKDKDYLSAIGHFQEARKIAPDAAAIYLDLGLAEAKIPGRELRAIAWFSAYLATNPSAPNAAAVKKETDALALKNKSNICDLIKSLENVIGKISEMNRPHASRDIATLWGEAGDYASALKLANLVQDADAKDYAMQELARQIRANIYAAPKADDQTPDNPDQIDAGPESKNVDAANAPEPEADAHDTPPQIPKESIDAIAAKVIDLTAKADAQAEAHDKKGALKTIAAAQEMLKAGSVDINEQSFVGYRAQKSTAQEAIGLAQIVIGDIAGARKTADEIQYTPTKMEMRNCIAEALAKKIPAPTVSNWLHKLDDSDPYHYAALNTAPFLDLTGYLKSLSSSEISSEIFYARRDALENIVKAQKIIDQMLELQAAQEAKR
jgi:hypothetical protein